MTDKIDQLYKLLNDVKNTSITSQMTSGDETNRTLLEQAKIQLNLQIFQQNQRIEDIKKHLAELNAYLMEEVKENNSAENEAKTVDHDKIVIKRESALSKTALTQFEFLLGDLNTRLIEIENTIQKLEPDSIQMLVRNITELVLHDQKRIVDKEMNTIKGSQAKNGKLVDMLQQELTKIDEKFKKDIDKKIEKKDLDVTKNQLRQKVLYS